MPDLQTAYRILDASANRASEGLRTLEEYARFGLEDASLAAQLKSLRHRLVHALGSVCREQLLAARDTASDVGTLIREPTEYKRAELVDVIRAAGARVQQSLRVLEEYAKVVDVNAARQIEPLRYLSYTLAADLELRLSRRERRERLAKSHLYVLLDAGRDGPSFEATVRQLVLSQVDMLQLRDRSVDDRTLLGRARLGTSIAREHGKLFIVNDRADLAVASDADGVHVGQDELPASDAREIIGARRILGVSTHSIEQAREAVVAGADYIGCGPVFPGRTKQFDAYVGTLLLEQVAGEIKIPAFAIGGIDETNVQRVVDAGIRRIAVSGVIRDADDPVAEARRLHERLSNTN